MASAQETICPICITALSSPATPNNCTHEFCHPCICACARHSNKCPICRRTFEQIICKLTGNATAIALPAENEEYHNPILCTRCDVELDPEHNIPVCLQCRIIHCSDCIGPFEGVCVGCALDDIDIDHLHNVPETHERSRWRGSRLDAQTLEMEALCAEIIIMTELITRTPAGPEYQPEYPSMDTSIARAAGLDAETRHRVRRLALAPTLFLYHHHGSESGDYVPLVRAPHILAMQHQGTEEQYVQWYRATTWDAADKVIEILHRINPAVDLNAVRNALVDAFVRPYVNEQDSWVR